jgi:hypothetical protein
MAHPSARELTQVARHAGYHVAAIEQLRPNRWLLTLNDDAGATILALVQARPLIGAADVQDLAELVRLRRPDCGILLAYGGSFTPAAQRTFIELGAAHLRLCTTLPPATRQDGGEVRPVGRALKPIP